MAAAAWFVVAAFPAWAADRDVARGPVTIEADRLGYDEAKETYHAAGNVVIEFTDGELRADYVDYSEQTKQASARGNAVVKSGKDVLAGPRMVFDVGKNTGTAYEGRTFFDQNHLYIRGTKLEKTGEATYRIEDAICTTCDGDRPDWHISGREVHVTVDGYGTVKHGKFHAAGLPVLYVPYMVFPAKTTRQSGFLFPYLAYSQDKDGMDVELPFFWAISPTMDATFFQRYMEKRGYKQGAEFRYYLGRDTSGILYGDFIHDTKEIKETDGVGSRDWTSGRDRWSVYWNHETYFDPTMYVRADIAKVSDRWYFKDFHAKNYYRDNYATNENLRFSKISFFGDESLTSLGSTARFVKNWDLYNLTALAQYTDDFSQPNNDATLQGYPVVQFTGIKRPLLKTPVYLEFSSLYGYLYREQGQRGHLVDIQPVLSVPTHFGDYLQLTPWATYKGTFWNRDDNETTLTEKQGARSIVNTGVSLTTEFYRVFDVGGGNLDKIKHAVRPEVTYSYTPKVTQNDLPDYVDPIPEDNYVYYAVTNTLTAKLKQHDGTFAYREFFRFKLYQMYGTLEDTREWRPASKKEHPFSELSMELDFYPFSYLGFSARNTIDVYTGVWRQTNYDLSLSDWRGDSAVIGYRYTQHSVEEINLALRAKITNEISGLYIHRRNLLYKQTVENSYGLGYNRQCWGVDVSYTETETDKRYMVNVSLLGLGRVLGF